MKAVRRILLFLLILVNFLTLKSIDTDFKLENKTSDKIFLSFGTSQPSLYPSKMLFVPIFPKEEYKQNITLAKTHYVWIMVSKVAPLSGSTKVLSVEFKPNKSKISVVVKDSTKNRDSKLEIASSSLIGSSNVDEQRDVLYEKDSSIEAQRLKDREEYDKRVAQIKKDGEIEKQRKEEADRKKREEEKRRKEQEDKEKNKGPRAWYTLLDQRSVPSDEVIVGFNSKGDLERIVKSKSTLQEGYDEAADQLAQKLRFKYDHWVAGGFKKREKNATDAEAKEVLGRIVEAAKKVEKNLLDSAKKDNVNISPKIKESLSANIGLLESAYISY